MEGRRQKIEDRNRREGRRWKMEDRQKMNHWRSKIIDRSWKAEEGRQKLVGAQHPPSPKSPYQPQAGLIGKVNNSRYTIQQMAIPSDLNFLSSATADDNYASCLS